MGMMSRSAGSWLGAAFLVGTCSAGCTTLLGDFSEGPAGGDGGGSADATADGETLGEAGGDASTQTHDAGADTSTHNDAGITDAGVVETAPPNPCANVATGTPCGTNLVCADGGCVACAAGSDCTPQGSCWKQTIACTTGSPLCEDAGPEPAGTTCGTDLYCSQGACAPCTPGNSCTPTNPCHLGTTSCSSGVATCTDTGTVVSDGTPCGTNEVCNSAQCVPCTSNVTCAPANPCHTGATSCATGTSVCNDTGSDLPNGTSCGNGLSCTTGNCASCVACTVNASQCASGGPETCVAGSNGCTSWNVTSCTGNAAGTACIVSSGVAGCGCNVASDCPVDQACDTATHVCGATCSQDDTGTYTGCNGGCCYARYLGVGDYQFSCQPGNTQTACGIDGGACSSCTTNPDIYCSTTGGFCYQL